MIQIPQRENPLPQAVPFKTLAFSHLSKILLREIRLKVAEAQLATQNQRIKKLLKHSIRHNLGGMSSSCSNNSHSNLRYKKTLIFFAKFHNRNITKNLSTQKYLKAYQTALKCGRNTLFVTKLTLWAVKIM